MRRYNMLVTQDDWIVATSSSEGVTTLHVSRRDNYRRRGELDGMVVADSEEGNRLALERGYLKYYQPDNASWRVSKTRGLGDTIVLAKAPDSRGVFGVDITRVAELRAKGFRFFGIGGRELV